MTDPNALVASVARRLIVVIATAVMFLAAAALTVGLIFGLSTVTAGDDATCGSPFSSSVDSSNLTDTAVDTCRRELKQNQTFATAALAAGVILALGGLMLFGSGPINSTPNAPATSDMAPAPRVRDQPAGSDEN